MIFGRDRARVRVLERKVREYQSVSPHPLPEIPSWIAPWGNDGDRSAWEGTLWPIWTESFDDEPFPFMGWVLDRELDGWRGAPRWARCVNGRTVWRAPEYGSGWQTCAGPELHTARRGVDAS